LELSPPSHAEDPPPRITTPVRKRSVSEEEIPWGEIIVEFGPDDAVPLGSGSKAPDKPGRRLPVESRSRAPEMKVPEPPLAKPQPQLKVQADIVGTPVMVESGTEDTSLRASEIAEWTFPGPGAPPLVFMAIAVVLLLCLL